MQAGASLTPGAETITIALTGRGPVRVRRDLWPIEAHASGRSSVCYHTPIPKDETDGYYLTVRRHADGRAIVYARIDAASAWTGTEDRAEGEMLAATEDVAAAIQRVGEACGLPAAVIRECLAELPPEDVDGGAL